MQHGRRVLCWHAMHASCLPLVIVNMWRRRAETAGWPAFVCYWIEPKLNRARRRFG